MMTDSYNDTPPQFWDAKIYIPGAWEEFCGCEKLQNSRKGR